MISRPCILFLILVYMSCASSGAAKRSHYDALGIKRSATTDEVKHAYRELAKRYHPDKTTDPKAPEKFIEITEAYEILADDRARRQYDAETSGRSTARRRQGFASQAFNDRQFEFDEIREFFNEMHRMKRGGESRSHSSSYSFSYSFGREQGGLWQTIKMFAYFSGAVWVAFASLICYMCCSPATNSASQSNSADTSESSLPEQGGAELPHYSYSMKLQNKGFLITACTQRSSIVLQQIVNKKTFRYDSVSFARYVGSSFSGNSVLKNADGDYYDVIATCSRGTKWAGHTIVDCDLESWIEKILGGEVALTHVNVEQCPI